MVRTLKSRLRKYFWKMLKVRWTLNSDINIIIENDNDWFVFNEIFTNREYDRVFEWLPEKINNPLVLDLGANVGYFALRMADEFLARKIKDFTLYSIEASSHNYEQLQLRVNQDQLIGKCNAIHSLVGYKQGSSFLTTQTDHFGYHINGKDDGAEKVNFINIEDMLRNDPRRITLLKCDIEGSEQIFLSEYGLLLKNTDLAIFEFHGGECDVEICRKYLANAGLEYIETLKTDPRYKTSVEIFKR